MAQWASLSPSLFLSLLATTQQFTHPHIISLHVNSFEEEKARALAIVEAVAHSGGGKNDINIGEKELNDPTSEDCIFNYFPLEHLKVLLSREKSFSTPSMEKFFFYWVWSSFSRIRRVSDEKSHLISSNYSPPPVSLRASEKNCRSQVVKLDTTGNV